MDIAALSAALLFALAIPIVMQYRILPVTGTPYWLFGILFILLIIKVLVSLYPAMVGKWVSKVSTTLLVSVLAIVLVGTTWTAIADRHRVAPVWEVHDIILQQEAAIRYLITGKNPYKETYFGTPVESFHYDEMGNPNAINPALYHFVMPPWYVLFSIPFYYLANHTFGYFDGRMPLLLCMVGILIILWKWFRNHHLGELAILFTTLSPATVNYFIEGRSDIFALFWLLASLFFLDTKKYVLSAVFMGLALISKQTIWFAFPLWVGYMWFTEINKNKTRTIFYVSISVAIAGFFTLPFLLWDAKAFIGSVILYLSAGGPTGYPVSGYGFSMILYSLGIIRHLHDYYPFTIWELGLGVPALIVSLWWIKKKPAMSTWFVVYGVVLFIIWYFSRYFNNSHIAFISSIFILGILKYYDEKKLTFKQ
jgi:hypothetical protein